MNIIEKIMWENMDSGSLVGAMVYRIVVGGGSHDIVDGITRIKGHGKGKVVLLVGSFTLENSEELFTMCKTLRDMGYVVAALCDGRLYFPWYALVNYLIVSTAKIWPGFSVQEFRWNSPKAQVVLPANPDSANMFVEGVPEDMLAFIEASSLKWRMLFRTRVVNVEVL